MVKGKPMIRGALCVTLAFALASPAFAQRPKPETIECVTDHQKISTIQTNPNAGESRCEYSCSYTAADKNQHQTSTASIILRPGTNTDDFGRVDGEPPYSALSIKGSCDSETCTNVSSAKLQCQAN
jgi:hypothetical protein